MWVAVGNGGWVQVDGLDGLPGTLYVRFSRDDSRRQWRATELYVDGRGEPITGGGLALAAVEAIAADPDFREQLEQRADLASVQLSVLASHYAHTFGRKATGWVADSYWSQFADSGVPRVERAPDQKLPIVDEPPPLTQPPDGRLTDEFLQKVARSYAAAVRARKPPAKTLGEQAVVSPRTVQRWLYIARQRGIIPPVRPGAW